MTDCRILLRGTAGELTFAGCGFVLAGGVVMTAEHVVAERRDGEEILVRTAEGTEFVAGSVTVDPVVDVAVLRAADVPVSGWRPGPAVVGARWMVASRPGDDDPQLTGTVTAVDRRVVLSGGHEVAVLQLAVEQPLDWYEGYSGSAVRLATAPSTVIGVVSEQVRSRLDGEVRRGVPVLYAAPMTTVARRFGLTPVAGPPAEMVERVRALLDDERAAEADRMLHRVARDGRQNAAYWYWKARVALAGGNLAVALAYTEQALGFDSANAPAVAIKVTILLLQNTPAARDQARRLEKDGRRLDPALDEWLDCLGTCGMFDGGVRTPTDLDARCPLPAAIS
ncbi:serine protease [Actinoplanes sp. NPDC051861]|uniref:serine protease n=1 Tax=Actinoplanes sp. NPDC051861 TaxID=3155170 RepID=UPI003439AB93